MRGQQSLARCPYADGVEPFFIDVDAALIADLHDRVARTRWPDADTTDWSWGTPPGALRELADHWRTGHDWSATQRRLNAHPQVLVDADGQRLHVLHAGTPGATPLFLLHDWPDAFIRFEKVLPLLADRFDLHLGDVPAWHRYQLAGAELAAEEQAYADDMATWFAAGGAYAMLHRTKPQTLAYALAGSPIALAAWFVEKLRSWSDGDGGPWGRFTRDEVLDLLTIAWATGTAPPPSGITGMRRCTRRRTPAG